MKMDFLRQLDILSPEETQDIHLVIIGAGGIGSVTTLTLAKIGFRSIEVWDDDVVENHNLPNQLYKVSDLGRRKVDALSEVVAEFTGVNIIPVAARFTPTERVAPDSIVISGVDSMKSRVDIWRAVGRNSGSVIRYIDARMGAEVGWIQIVNLKDRDSIIRYNDTLYDDERAHPLPCTAQAIWYNEAVIAGIIGRMAAKIARRKEVEREVIFDIGCLIVTTDG